MEVPIPDVEKLTDHLKSRLQNVTFDFVKTFACSRDSGTHLLQWKLLEHLKNDSSDEFGQFKNQQHYDAIAWILNDRKALEALLCSGDVIDKKWKKVIDLLARIISVDPKAKDDWRLKLSVAVSLTFSTPVRSLAYSAVDIDPLKRYLSFIQWADAGFLFPVFYSLTTWQMRYVVGSWATDEELIWARENVLEKFKDPGKIGEATHQMVKYREKNDKGVSVHDGANYYHHKPVTLALMYQVGAVCGGVSKFGCAISQAFGIPAMPVGQPGHCAFLWWREGEWVLSNDCSGLCKSIVHDGIQWTWNRNAEYVLLMECVQKDIEKYVLAEQLRVAALFCSRVVALQALDYSSLICPANFMVWSDLAKHCKHFSEEKNMNIDILSIFQQYQCEKKHCEVLSRGKPVNVSDCADRKHNVVDGTSSEWWTDKETAWIEIDLEENCVIRGVEIQWWGTSISKNYAIYAASKGGDYKKIKCIDDEIESPEGYNSWSKFEGWEMSTKSIKFCFKDGSLDPWGFGKWFGIRQIEVLGKEEPELEIVSFGKNVTASECNEMASNLVDGTSSEWWAGQRKAWIQIDLEQLCNIKTINLQWCGNASASEVVVSVSTKSDDVDFLEVIRTNKIKRSDSWTEISMAVFVKDVKLELGNGTIEQFNTEKSFGLRNVFVHGLRVSLKDSLINKAKQALSAYLVVSSDVCKLLNQAGCAVLSHMAICRVSDCHERAQNIIDGTDSEWWTEHETAWIEVELMSACTIYEVRIHWWGLSFAKDLHLMADNSQEAYKLVRTTSDEIESPDGYNSWSVFNGWNGKTRFLKFYLKDGSLDPWGMNKYFGIRKILVIGES